MEDGNQNQQVKIQIFKVQNPKYVKSKFTYRRIVDARSAIRSQLFSIWTSATTRTCHREAEFLTSTIVNARLIC